MPRSAGAPAFGERPAHVWLIRSKNKTCKSRHHPEEEAGPQDRCASPHDQNYLHQHGSTRGWYRFDIVATAWFRMWIGKQHSAGNLACHDTISLIMSSEEAMIGPTDIGCV
jgi:hypothetical protein